MLVFKFTLIFAFLATSQCFPTTSVEEVDHELIGGFFEGDMELDDEESGRNGIADESKRWPNSTVFFKISEEFGRLFNAQKEKEVICFISRR